MVELCRAAYGTDWADHLEYALWHAVVQGPMDFGRIHLDQGTLDELRRLADACGGWIRTDRDGTVECLRLEAWQDCYAANVDLVHMDTPTPPPAGPSGAG
jgi:hypothetical protein